MNLTVQGRARAVATFRHVAVWAMETCARWTPVTAQMEAKVMLGRHIWDHAQHADALGKRTYELRKPEHYTIPPSNDYAALLEAVVAPATAPERMAALYQGFLPGLIARYRAYVAATDAILDEPTVVVCERIVRDLERHVQEAAQLQRELGWDVGAPALAARERAIDSMVADEQPVAA